MNGFPNLFIVGGTAQAAVTINFTHILAEQAKHIAAVVRRCRFEGVEVMEIREEAEQGWTKTMAEKVVDRSKFERECTPGYYNNEGKVDDSDPTLFGRTYGGKFTSNMSKYVQTGSSPASHWTRKSLEPLIGVMNKKDEGR